MKSAWSVRLVEAAEMDYLDIIRRSAQAFGTRQAETYSEILDMALGSLIAEGTAAIGVKAREEIGAGIFSLHVSRIGRKASHFLVFQVVEGNIIEVLRILHEKMDLARHLSLPEEPPHH